MKPSTSLGLAATAFVTLTMLPGEIEASRGRLPIPIIYGSDESIIHVSDLSPEAKQVVSRKLGQDVAIGFHYKRFHIFWFDFWTWDGRHVLYKGDKCWQLEPGDWERILSESEREGLGKPFWYRVPGGLAVVMAVAILCVMVLPIGHSRDTARVKKLLQDERYEQALKAFAGMPRAGPPVEYHGVEMEPAEVAFIKTVEDLRARGVPEEEAEDNLQMILRVIDAEAVKSVES
jgi:hypothetical protein